MTHLVRRCETIVFRPHNDVGVGIALPIVHRSFVPKEGGVLGYFMGTHMPYELLLEKVGPCVFCPGLAVEDIATAERELNGGCRFVPVVVHDPDTLPVYFKPALTTKPID
jgi:hypothetical protein